jgi:AcrR family transcriptional regulator
VADHVKGSRGYSSTVRAEGARRTRGAVVAAATRLFVEHGYEGTSLAGIAREAGVARPTVIAAHGSKAALLSRVLDEALAGDDEAVPVRDRPWFRPVWDATSAAGALTAYAGVCVLIAARAGAVVEVVRRASDSAPEVRELWDRWLAGRRAGAAMVIGRDVVTAALRPPLTPETAADVLWTLNDPDLYVSLVDHRGWPVARFEAWLAEAMCRLLLADDARAGGPDPAAEPPPRPARRR